MRHRFDHEISVAVLACYKYYRENIASPKPDDGDSLYQKLADTLRFTLGGLAQAYEGLYEGWAADHSNPGYMIKLALPNAVRAPVHLVPTYPTTEMLDSAWKLAQTVRLSDNSVICISGSNAISRALTTVSDVDFSEYILGQPNRLPALAQEKGPWPQRPICTSVKIGNSAWHWPALSEAVPSASHYDWDSGDIDKSTCKADFLAPSRTGAPVDVSNIGFICDQNGRSASLELTFAAQEAIITMSNWVPNSFCNPGAMGRYLSWLIEEIRKKRSVDIVKSLKRSLSLSRIAFLPAFTDRISEIFEEFCEPEEAQIDLIKASIQRYRNTGYSELSDVILALEFSIRTKEAELDLKRLKAGKSSARFIEKSNQLVDRILKHVGDLTQ